jgi:hypothetical protein
MIAGLKEGGAPRKPSYTDRCRALDLMCASFPEGHPPPDALLELMRWVLRLPAGHTIGGWCAELDTALKPKKDLRGKPDFANQRKAADIAARYYETERKEMSAHRLAKAMGHTSTSTVREWMSQPAWRQLAGLPPHEGGGGG